MHLHSIAIKNFRLLQDVTLVLEQSPTVIVGRNNSGKTSLTELFRRLLSEKEPTFRFEDFSLSAHDEFWKAYKLKADGKTDDEVRQALPSIDVRLTVRYDSTSLGPLSGFVIDLDPACFDAVILIRYTIGDGNLAALFETPLVRAGSTETEQKAELCRAFRERVPERYVSTIVAVDPGDPTNQQPVRWAAFRKLLHGGFINAQRGLDDITDKESVVLGKVLESLFRTASRATSDAADRTLAKELEEAVAKIQQNIQEGFSKQLTKLLPTFTMFGYPGLSDPHLGAETSLDVQRLLTDNTRIHYTGVNGINLPESYNGLGTRNLIYILLRLHQFFKAYMAEEHAPGMQLVFIEEPECHLHPQMQAVFIHKLSAIANAFAESVDPPRSWPVQFLVTTHSSHVANRAPFDAIRYFLATSDGRANSARRTKIKDLRQGLASTPTPDREFLHKYMTVTRCDLLFADKAILIEGESERLLMPQMIETVDKAALAGSDQLSSQYVSIVEVGGAHAHLFFDLLEFLELRTLIVTDLDSTKQNANGRGTACKVSVADGTSNACLKSWFNKPAITPQELLACTDADKVRAGRRIAFQIPEATGEPCGRTFEPAFMLANRGKFAVSTLAGEALEDAVCEQSEAISKKSDFAIEHGIRALDWNVPKYIRDGLAWLAKNEPSQPPRGATPEPASSPQPTPLPTPNGPTASVAASQPGTPAAPSTSTSVRKAPSTKGRR